MSLSVCRGPNPRLCCNAVATASLSSSWRGEKNVVCNKTAVRCLSYTRIWNSTVRAYAAAVISPATTVKAIYGVTAKNLSSSLVASAVVVRRLGGVSVDQDDDDWESYIFQEGDEEENNSVMKQEKVDDWAEKARERAILSIQQRGLPVTALLEERGKEKKKKKKKKNLKKKPSKEAKLDNSLRAEIDQRYLAPSPKDFEPPVGNVVMSDLGSGERFKKLVGLGNYWKSLSQTGEMRILEDVQTKGVQVLIEDKSELVGPELTSPVGKGPQRASTRQRRQEDFDLNRSLVEAISANDVLSVVSGVLESSPWEEGRNLLSPTNISTALHRIAKHMEAESMPKTDRLSFARQKTMASLVSAATESLSQCSAQSVANIAWALSKVGGSSLYWAEMDLLAEAAMSDVLDLEPQHIANISGAFASMQHSLPALFKVLDQRACSRHRSFRPQELAQLLWAFATLNEPAKLLLDSLDSHCEASDRAVDTTLSGFVSYNDEQSTSWTSAETYFSNFTVSELCSLSWSYTVMDELKRPSFALIWNQIVKRSQGNSSEVQEMAGRSVQLSQLHQASLSLELEYPELNLRPGEPLGALARSEWEKLKGGKMSTSTTQKDVERLLMSTGRQWVGEYSASSYSLDVGLAEERIALEIDGPTHFARNTGTPLGHTVLKRRQISAAGWTIFSVPYLEWDELFGEHEQMEYLRNLLRQHIGC